MHTMISRRLNSLIIAAAVLGLTACASPANREAMSAADVTVTKKYPYSISVQTQGGNETGAMTSSNISNEDLKSAIEISIVGSKLFKSVVQGKNGDYELTVTVIQLSKPLFGTSYTVNMEAAWALTKISDNTVVMRKAIKSSHTATMGDALVAVTRLRLAVEGAARNGIVQGLQAISELNL